MCQDGGTAVVPEPPAVTFIAPPRSADVCDAPFFLGRKASKPKGRAVIADEECARRAIDIDGGLPPAALAGSSIEHLARIALG